MWCCEKGDRPWQEDQRWSPDNVAPSLWCYGSGCGLSDETNQPHWSLDPLHGTGGWEGLTCDVGAAPEPATVKEVWLRSSGPTDLPLPPEAGHQLRLEPRFVEAPDLVYVSNKRLTPSALVLLGGFCEVPLVILVGVGLLCFIYITCGGRGQLLPCFDIPDTEPAETEAFRVYIATNSVAAWLTMIPVIWLSLRASTVHLRVMSRYMVLSWLASILHCFQYEVSCGARPVEDYRRLDLMFSILTSIALVASMCVFQQAVVQRLKALEAAALHPLGVRRTILAAQVCYISMMLGAVVYVTTRIKRSWGEYLFPLFGSSIWMISVSSLVYVSLAVLNLNTARRRVVMARHSAAGRLAEEAQRAAKALRFQQFGIILGYLVPYLKWTTAYLDNGLLWPIPAVRPTTTLGFAVMQTLPSLIEVFGSTFAALAFSGSLTGAVHAGVVARIAESKRRHQRQLSSLEFQRQCSEAGDDLDRAWRQKVQELSGRGFTLEALLDFYEGLGTDVMEHYEPTIHTTSDVVRHAILPLTKDRGCPMSELMMQGQYVRPKRMVTHNWSNIFCDLVAAITADVLGESEYAMVSYMLQRDVRTLREWVRSTNTGSMTYWVCAFSVNQHLGICNVLPNQKDCVNGCSASTRSAACDCGLERIFNDTPPTLPDGRSIPCEMNKFEDLMKFLSASDPEFSQVIAVDFAFSLFSRAWCVAELATARATGMLQMIVFHSEENLEANEQVQSSLKIEEMQATRIEDKQEILRKIPDVSAFNAHLRQLFKDLLHAWHQLDVAEQMVRAGRIARWSYVAHGRDSCGLWKSTCCLSYSTSGGAGLRSGNRRVEEGGEELEDP